MLKRPFDGKGEGRVYGVSSCKQNVPRCLQVTITSHVLQNTMYDVNLIYMVKTDTLLAGHDVRRQSEV